MNMFQFIFLFFILSFQTAVCMTRKEIIRRISSSPGAERGLIAHERHRLKQQLRNSPTKSLNPYSAHFNQLCPDQLKKS